MRILVIDDTAINLASALQTLAGHDVVTCNTYDKAVQLIERATDYDTLEDECEARGIRRPSPRATDEARNRYWAERESIEKELKPAPFDAVLVDLLMPAGRDAQGGEGLKYVGTIMAVGYPLAMMAALHGARYVGVMTATNHHHHPAAATFDHLGGSRAGRGGEEKPAFTINGASVAFCHEISCLVDGTVCGSCGGVQEEGEKCYSCENTGLGKGKDWGRVLAFLMKE